jgi:hypothetical protein
LQELLCQERLRLVSESRPQSAASPKNGFWGDLPRKNCQKREFLNRQDAVWLPAF